MSSIPTSMIKAITHLVGAVETKQASQRERIRVRRVALAKSEEARIAAQLQHCSRPRGVAS